MKIILKKDEEELKSIEINYDWFDNIIFGTDKVKEIAFVKDVNNSDELGLKELYDLLEQFNYKECNNLIVYYDKDHYFQYRIPVKDVYYRVLSYMRERNVVMQENLCIRFQEDNQPRIDFINEIALCNKKECSYFNNGKCSKYKNITLEKYYHDYIICENCYLEMWPSFGKPFRERMENFYE